MDYCFVCEHKIVFYDLMSLETERREDRKHRHVGFTALERKVYDEYRRRGYSNKKAKEYALRTAGKVYWEIARKR